MSSSFGFSNANLNAFIINFFECKSEAFMYKPNLMVHHVPVDHENSEISLLGSVREAFLFLKVNVILS